MSASVDSHTLRDIPVSDLSPSEYNARLFIEEEKLSDLVAVYTSYAEGNTEAVLPDPPVVRMEGLEILAGHRRVYAAYLAGVEQLPCRMVSMSDMEAYKFILEHNTFVPLTVVEKAYRAVEMQSLGFSIAEIEASLGGVSLFRYLTVGRLVSPEMFTNAPKQCDPTIVDWYGASQLGATHFYHCFTQWDTGVWDAETCKKEFRRTGTTTSYMESYQKGLRIGISNDGRKLHIRGTIPLDSYTNLEALEITNQFAADLHHIVRQAIKDRFIGFGDRRVYLYNPDTLKAYEESEPNNVSGSG
jgi:hypothetical protein